jgi:hypothetical protein
MKRINLILAFLFALFAVVQYNDPDPWAWILMYCFIGAICAFAAFGKYNEFIIGFSFGICLFWAIELLPDFFNWIEMGTPNIATEMKTEEPHIELVREFLGIFICMGVLVFQLIQFKKRSL